LKSADAFSAKLGQKLTIDAWQDETIGKVRKKLSRIDAQIHEALIAAADDGMAA